MVLGSLPLWLHFANLFFTVSGIHGDILVIRLALVCAYLCFLMNTLLSRPAPLPIDSITWSVIGLYVHTSSLLLLIRDEAHVTLEKGKEPLWRMFYRTGGLSAKLFKILLEPKFEVVTLCAGEVVPTEDFFYIIYRGRVQLRLLQPVQFYRLSRTLKSGEMFDLSHLQMFSNDKFFKEKIECTCMTQTTLFRFSKVDMERIAHHRYAKSIWQGLLINNLSFVVEAYGQVSSTERDLGDFDIDRIFAQLEEWELPPSNMAGSGEVLRRPLQHLVRAFCQSFSPPWPFGGHQHGMRQTMLPAPRARRDTASKFNDPSSQRAGFHWRVSQSKLGDREEGQDDKNDISEISV